MEKDYADQKNMNKQETIIDCIMTRTSVRQFTSEQLSQEQISVLLRAGMAAPSAGNKQPWRFLVLQDKETQERIAATIGPAKPAAKAPTLIVVCGDLTQTFPGEGLDYWVEDCSAATQNILLAAHALQLGAVWLGVYPLKERCDFLRQLLALPDNIMPLGMVAVGHPAETPKPKDKWHEEFVSFL